jgi:hypothetical protein
MSRRASLLCSLLAAMASFAFAEGQKLPQSLGAELGYFSVPLGSSDPYSFGTSAGLWYNLALGQDSPLTAGAWLTAAGFRSLDSDFGASFMYYGGLELGYSLRLLQGEGSAVSLRPLARAGWYARSVVADGETEWGSRPFAALGCLVDLKLDSFDAGMILLVSVPIDNAPVFLLGLTQRLGLCL